MQGLRHHDLWKGLYLNKVNKFGLETINFKKFNLLSEKRILIFWKKNRSYIRETIEPLHSYFDISW